MSTTPRPSRGSGLRVALGVVRLRVRVHGLVQGVGFRPWVYGVARRLGLAGWVRNDEQGVLLEVQGVRAQELVVALRGGGPPLARIDSVTAEALEPVAGEREFRIEGSARVGSTRSAIGPDIVPCEACLAELFNPADRRFRYPFLNCTHCGPRYTITRALPYDRPQTSLSAFPLCDACRGEYLDPANRRFHAQAIACPRCGPRLSHSVETIVERLRAGGIVALKGLGGYLLACDARDESAVARLRARKERDAKPFAVMVSSLASARLFAEVREPEEELLCARAGPIVLLRRTEAGASAAHTPAAPLAPSVAVDLAWVGLMLPSTPLHALLFHEAAGRPTGTAWLREPLDLALVMTSANPGGEPLIVDDDDARARLAPLADLVVTHERAIVVRADDSVARVVAGGPTLLRRARGYVPEPVKLARAGPSVVALGAHLKCTVCVTRGDEAFVSQHIGDLDDAATFRFLEESLEHLLSTLEVKPEAVACDLHPDFLSTRKAEALASELSVPLRRVQHHHAHLAAVLAEHRRVEATVGLALDGFGLGPRGESWGGELLRLEGDGFERLGHLRQLRQPGGDVAARQPWRMAAAALHALGHRELPARCRPPGGALVEGVMQLLDKGLQAPQTSSCGRLFDAACGLLGVRLTASYEGEAPMVLESLVRSPTVALDGWRIEDGVLDLLPLLAHLLELEPREGAELFHGTLTAALVAWALPAARANGGLIALSGGCLGNATLAEGLVSAFAREGVLALLPRQVPANDGGLSLGQAWVAACPSPP